MASAFINDGYTETAVLHEVPGLYPRVEFTFRPMLIEQRVFYYKVAQKLEGVQLRRLIAGHLAQQLVEWDVKDRKGNVVPITVDNVMRLKSRFFDRLFAVVSTEEAPDESPDRDAAEADLALADARKAAETGRTIQELREERERKN